MTNRWPARLHAAALQPCKLISRVCYSTPHNQLIRIDFDEPVPSASVSAWASLCVSQRHSEKRFRTVCAHRAEWSVRQLKGTNALVFFMLLLLLFFCFRSQLHHSMQNFTFILSHHCSPACLSSSARRCRVSWRLQLLLSENSRPAGRG